MIIVYINNQELILNIKKSITVLNAAAYLNIQIPSFCFNENNTIVGNCRMCIVEVKGLSKYVASCAFNVSDGMEIYTDTYLVKQARESVLELLLVNHPLDCPICDQGGECDLQDLTMQYGRDRGRFYKKKRSISDISLGVVVTTSFTRCIQCTKCVRFLDELANYNKLGMIGRSKMSMIEKMIDKKENIQHELLGNIVDLCPVGALTSKVYNFKGRKWELQLIQNLDIFDSLGSNISIETRELSILRILPKINLLLNDEWISDKIRYNFDGFLLQRINNASIYLKIDYIYIFNNKKYNLKKKAVRHLTWEKVFLIFKEDVLKSKNLKNMQLIFGNEISLDLLLIFREFHNFFNLSGFYLQNNMNNKHSKNITFDSTYLFRNTLKSIENNDLILIVGNNITTENVVLSIRLRKALLNGARIFNIGCNLDSLNNVVKIGNNLDIFFQILRGQHMLCFDIMMAKNPLIILSADRELYLDSFCDHFLRRYMVELSSYISYINISELGYFNYNINTKLYYLIGAENIKFLNNSYVIYQGTHYDYGYKNADIVLPSNLFVEEEQLFMNLTAFTQKSIPLKLPNSSVYLLNYSGSFIEYIIKFFYPLYNFSLYLNNLLDIYSLKFNNVDNVLNVTLNKDKLFLFDKFLLYNYPRSIKYNIKFNFLNNLFSNYYLSDSISRVSIVMRKIALTNNYYIK